MENVIDTNHSQLLVFFSLTANRENLITVVRLRALFKLWPLKRALLAHNCYNTAGKYRLHGGLTMPKLKP